MARFQYLLRNGIIALFLCWRLLDFVLAYIATFIVPYSGHFSHPKTLTAYNIPHWIRGFVQFDGIFYLRIAQDGYSQFEQAFFPFYPLTIKFLSPIFSGNKLVTSLAIANLSFLVGLIVFRKYLQVLLPTTKRSDIFFTIIFLLLFPTSFFFGSSYTESLFFLLVVSALYFLHKKNYWLVALFAFFASLTRFIGVFLFVPILISSFPNFKSGSSILKNRDKLLTLVAPFLGLGTYMYYLWRSVGDPLAFFTSQAAFGAGRSTGIILLPQVLYRYLKIFFTVSWSVGYFIAICELFIFLFVLYCLLAQLQTILKSKDKELLGLNLFSLCNLLVPSLTGTLGSIPRYSLLSLSFFIYLGLLKNNKTKLLLCLIFILLHVVLVTLFIQGHFVS